MMNVLFVFCFAFILVCSCLFIAYFGKTWNLKPLVALSSGALLSICFLDFLPYAFKGENSFEKVSCFILVGILAQGLADLYIVPHLAFLDKWLKKEEVNSSHQTHSHSHSLSLGSICSIVGCLSVCSFFDGIRLVASLSLKESVTLITVAALFFHLLSEGVLVAVLALTLEVKKRALFIFIFCISGALLLGALFAQIFFLTFSFYLLLAFSTGILTYVCFVHLLPFSLKQNSKIWFFIGLISFSLIHFLD